MSARPLRIVILAIVAFAAGIILAILALRLWPTPPPLPTLEHATVLSPARPLPALALVDQDGQPLGAGFFDGRWTLVFFGFTACPDICPTTLATLAQATRSLADLPAAERPRVLLITVDPERDDPARLAAYVRFFDPAFLGATGEVRAVDEAAAAFGVPYSKVSLPEGGYTFDHGSGVSVVGPAGGIVAYLSAPLAAEVVARDYRRIVTYATGKP